MSRLGKGAPDIFTSTSDIPSSPAQEKGKEDAKRPGRPPVHTEDWTKVTVVLLNRQIVFLDSLSTEIRKNTGAVVKRAEILRALVDAVEESSLDMSGSMSEKELKELLVSRLQG